MILLTISPSSFFLRIPHVGGGDPQQMEKTEKQEMYSPRRWGVIPLYPRLNGNKHCIPHVGGGDPPQMKLYPHVK